MTDKDQEPGPLEGDPSPEEILQRAAEIRACWHEEKLENHRTADASPPWRPPGTRNQ